ncbi:CDP-glycerol glycerophosphotransferase family protein [Roseateles sp.]|uniref:O-linked N-acetylglucosamine transferase family protein n=1 Tax=Roseateles sp. TaxID=1971397 RepID=UPI0039EBC594
MNVVAPRSAPTRQGLKARQAGEAGRKAMAARQWEKASAFFESAAKLAPEATESWLDLVELGLTMGDAVRAEQAARQLIALAPTHAQAHLLLLQCLELQANWAGLAAACEQLPEPLRRDPQALEKQALALFRAHRPKDAVQVCIDTLQLDPKRAATHYRLGLALKQLGMDAQSAISFETASLLASDGKQGYGVLAQSLLVHQLGRLARWEELEQQGARLLERLARSDIGIPPFALLSLPASRAQHLHAGRLEAERLARGLRPLPPVTAAGTHKPRLRLGLLSSDFFKHATVTLLVELVELLDRERFEVFLYCHSPVDGSAQQRRMRAAADQFRDVNNVNDAEVARLMREDGIDIAIDLKGHTENGRMQVLSQRPAPVQLSFLGYPGTTGADFLDYVIGDPVVTPLAHQDGYSECIAQMPHSYQPNDRQRAPLPPVDRAALGLPAGVPVLCCFNQTYKITAEMADLWAQILNGSPRAVLWLLNWNESASKALVVELDRRGVAAERLIFSSRVAEDLNVARLQAADLFLDTWPCNAHTTASDALWAGVPVLTVPGETFASRVAASLAQACELPDFVCVDAQAYVERAVALTQGDMGELRAAQTRLRARRTELPLFDAPRYARDFAALLERMWARAEAGLPPEPLAAAVEHPPVAAAPVASPSAPASSSLTDALNQQIAAALAPPVAAPIDGLGQRVAELEASNGQLLAAIDALVDNIVQLRNDELRGLDQRGREQDARIEELQAQLNLERSNRDLADVSRMHPKERIVVFVGGTYFGNNVKYAWLAALAQAEALRAECWFLPMDAAQAEQVALTGGNCFPVAPADWTAGHLHTALAAAVAVIDDHLLNSNPYAAALLAGARQVQLWHGVSIKEIGLRNLAGLGRMSPHFARVLHTCGPFSRLVGTSAGQEQEFRRWFAFGQYAPIGYPRNDVLLREPTAHDLVNVDMDVYRRAQDFLRRGRKVILYAPTFRDGNPGWLLQAGLPELASAVAASGDLLVVNLHPVEQPLVPKLAQVMPQVSFVRARSDVYPLLSQASLLVTDYSSIMFDYLLLDRPVLLFRPDHAAYTTQSRQLFDAKLETPPGAVASTTAELLKLLKATKESAASGQARRRLLEVLHDQRDGAAGERLVALVAEELDEALGVR